MFCGASYGRGKIFTDAAMRLGKILGSRGDELIYGGSSTGLMGILADATLAHGGTVTGVIPRGLVEHEIAHPHLTAMEIVESMHERKARMADKAEKFIALPGGFGTADELFEIITWTQLGFQAKPIGLLNIDGYFDPLLKWIVHCVEMEFVKSQYADFILVDDEPEALLDRLDTHIPAPPSLFAAGNYVSDSRMDTR
ncbi:TIGR00730 family Rossman fold protein [Nocardia ninae]|uniref:LOG family protein n=1 Tax=Nocardia ninae TaxID=356145 RepID=UPI002482D832|nr:TIGR00730 family Rossman fold protein [Nocardia ninae]